MSNKIFGSDRITINEVYSFKKSEILGMITKAEWMPSNSKYEMRIFLIVGGSEYMVDTRWEDKSGDSLDKQKKDYHKKWQETLSNIGKDEIKKEKVMI